LNIGPYQLDNNLALAPMAGVTDLPFRRLCRRLGAGYVVGEMVHSDPRLRHSRKTRLRSDHRHEPEPIAVQIAGSEPAWLAEAAAWNVDQGAQVIDINMGCPAKKVCNKAAGSALLEDEERVGEILAAVTAAVNVPVTLKIRTGPSRERRNGVRIAQIAEQSGIACLAVHGRSRADRFEGRAEYATIREICRRVAIPVFANGDIKTPQQAEQVLDATGAAGIMIGRGAQGNPWIFRDVRHFLATGQRLDPPDPLEILAVMQQHLQGLYAFYGEAHGVRVARKHLGWYLADQPGGNALRQQLVRLQSGREQLDRLASHFEALTVRAA